MALAKLVETVRFADSDYLTDADNRGAEFLMMRFTHGAKPQQMMGCMRRVR